MTVLRATTHSLVMLGARSGTAADNRTPVHTVRTVAPGRALNEAAR
jgi:hypothetical protein